MVAAPKPGVDKFDTLVWAMANEPRVAEMLAVVQQPYLPHQVVALRHPDQDGEDEIIPLLAGRTARDGQPTAYVCRNYACRQPVTTAHDLAAELGMAVE